MPQVAIPRPGETKDYLLASKQADSKGLGAKVKATLLEAFTGALSGLFQWVIGAFLQAFQNIMENIETPYSRMLRGMVETAEGTGKIPGELKGIASEIKHPTEQVGALLTASFGGAASSGLASSILDPILTPLRYALWSMMPQMEISPQDAILLYNLGFLDEQGYLYIMRKYGYAPDRAELLKNIASRRLDTSEIIPLLARKKLEEGEAQTLLRYLGYPESHAKALSYLAETLLGVAEVQELYRRGKIQVEEARKKLAAQGFSEENIINLLDLSKRIIGPGEVRDLLWWGAITKEQATTYLSHLGYSREDAVKLVEVSWATPNITTVREGFLRGIISEEQVDDMLARTGVREEERGIIKSLFYMLPPVSDLIRFSVREVFSPEIRERFGQDEDYPEEFSQYARQAGLSEEWARAYWAAHWELPSLEMGYEMLHRGIITREDMELLLRAQDVMPFWRDKLLQISYNPFTRVDIRRMYQTGVLTKEDVLKAYKDIGYDDWHAEKLMQFTIMGAAEQERDLTRTDILGGYREGIITREEASSALVKMGYDEEEAEFYLDREDYKAEKERRDTLIKIWKELYITRRVEQNDVIRALSEVNLPASQIDTLLSSWEAERTAQLRTPTLSDLRKYFKKKIIDETTFKKELEVLGFSPRYVDWIVKDAQGGE